MSTTFASLSSSGSATVNFAAPNVGTLGNGGDTAAVYFTQAPALVNGIIGGWAVVNGADFAGYTAASGVAAPNVNGVPNYTNTNNLGAAGATDNVNLTQSVHSTGRGRSTPWRSGRRARATYVSLAATGTDVFTIGSGGFSINNSGNQIVNVAGGILTSGTGSAPSSLYLYSNTTTNTPVIYSQIANNASGGAVSLVKSGAGALSLQDLLFIPSTSAWASGTGTVSVTNAAGVFAGEVIGGGNNLPASATVTAISGNVITMSSTATGAGNSGTWISFAPAQVATTVTAGTNTVALTLASTQGWTTGMAVGGTGIPAATTITGITLLSGSNYQLTLSNNATASGTPTLSYGASRTPTPAIRSLTRAR